MSARLTFLFERHGGKAAAMATKERGSKAGSRPSPWGRGGILPATSRKRFGLAGFVMVLAAAIVATAGVLAFLASQPDGSSPGPQPLEITDEDIAPPAESDDPPEAKAEETTPEPEDTVETPPAGETGPEEPAEEAGEEAGDAAEAEAEEAPDQAEEAEVAPRLHENSVVWLAISPDGSNALSASTDTTIKLWDLSTGRLVRDVGAHPGMARAALYLPDGRHALTSGDEGTVILHDIETGAPLHTFEAADQGSSRKIAVSPNGGTMAVAHESGRLSIWDLERREMVSRLEGHAWPLASVAISPDGAWLASGSIDGELRIWDLRSGQLKRMIGAHERGIYGLAFTPDGAMLASASGDQFVALWNMETGQEVRRMRGHSGTVYVIDVSPDGRKLVTGSLDGTARLWDVESGVEEAFWLSPAGPAHAVAFIDDGLVLVGTSDGAIRTWNPATGTIGETFKAGE